MSRIKAGLVIALVFVAGFAAGVVTTRAVVRHFIRTVMTRPERVRELFEKRMAVRLRLDAGQRQKVDEILGRTQGEIQQLRGDFAPRFRGILSNAESEVSAVLSPDQRKKFDQLLEENRPWLQGGRK